MEQFSSHISGGFHLHSNQFPKNLKLQTIATLVEQFSSHKVVVSVCVVIGIHWASGGEREREIRNQTKKSS